MPGEVAETETPGRHLPMPVTRARRIEAEREVYRERQRLHQARFPDYVRGWHRPTSETASHICYDVLNLPLVSSPDRVAAEQAIVVALDAAITAGESGRMLTTNVVGEELGRRWSDHYRHALECGPARPSWDMRRTTLRGAWRDILRNGIEFTAILDIVQRGGGRLQEQRLYTTGRVSTRGYMVTLDDDTAAVRTQFVSVLDADPDYRRADQHRVRVLFADEPTPPRRERCEVAAEWKYNIVTVGPRSKELIRRLEAARLYLNVAELRDEVGRLGAELAEIRSELQTAYGLDIGVSSSLPRGVTPRRGSM